LSLNSGLGWSCGDVLADSRDSKQYDTVLIGTQCWFAENLDYDDGCSSAVWINSTDVGWCGYYTGGPFANEGLLYQWSAAMNDSTTAGAQGLCPTGWHIPTHDEWTTLERSVCTSGTCATDFPYDTTTTGFRGTNEGANFETGGNSGFNGVFAGFRLTDGAYTNRLSEANFWTSLIWGASAWHHGLPPSSSLVYRNANSKVFAFSVRCIKNN